MDFRILGPLQAIGDDGQSIDLGPLKQRMLLAVLLLHANEVVSTDRIIDALWGEDATGKHSALHVQVSRLRSVLEPGHQPGDKTGILTTRDPGYLISVDEGALDATAFEILAAEGRHLLSTDPEDAAVRLSEALGLWRGPPLEDFTYEDFARPAIERLNELKVSTLEDRIEADLARGLSRELVAELEKLVRDHPLRSRLVGQLMLALHRSNRQAEALWALDRHRRLLGTELGIEPPAELVRLEEQILVQDRRLQLPATDVGTAWESEPVNPFVGLRPFEEADAAVFHGREALIDEMVRALRGEQDSLAVIGPSGSGKSSAVRAGLIPALRNNAVRGSDRWLMTSMTPGLDPFAEAEAALRQATENPPDGLAEQFSEGGSGLLRGAVMVLPEPSSRLLLFVDQFEELFTMVDDEAIRSRFLDNLVTAASDPRSRVILVLALRADYYERTLQYPEFGKLVTANVVHVTPFSADELVAAAQRPAARAGASFEPGLLEQLISDVGDRPGSLPLFQYTVTELFEHRAGSTLMMSSYQAIGGVSGALGRRADQLYRELDPGLQGAARQLFLRLVSVTADGDRARRRVEAGELIGLDVDVARLHEVVERYGSSRLLAFDQNRVSGSPTVEVAHEALFDAWSRCRDWIEEQQEDLRRLDSLKYAIREWERAGESPDYLFTGSRLTELDQWRTSSSIALTEKEHRFIDDGRERRAAEQEAERLTHRAANRRLRIALAGVVSALVVALLAGGYGFVQRDRADRSAEASETRRLASDAKALLGSDRRLALLVAAEAYARDPNVESLGALQEVLAGAGPLMGYVGGGTRYDAVEWADSGDVIVAVGENGIDVFDADRHRLILRVKLVPGLVPGPGISGSRAALDVTRDGHHAAASTAFGGVTIVDLVSGEKRLLRHVEAVTTVEFSHDGDRLATADRRGVVRIWDVDSGEVVVSIDPVSEGTGSNDGVTGLAFAPDDDLLAVIEGSRARRLHTDDGRPVASTDQLELIDAENGDAFTVNRSSVPELMAPLPQGGFVQYLEHGALVVVDEGGGTRSEIDVQLPSVTGVDSDPIGTRYVVASADGLMVGALDGSGLIARGLPRGSRTVLSVSSDGTLVAGTDPNGGGSALWQLGAESDESLNRLVEPADSSTSVEPHPSARMIGRVRADGGVGPSLQLVDAIAGDEVEVGSSGCVWPRAYSEDGALAAFGCPDGLVIVDLETGASLREIRSAEVCEHCLPHPVRSLDFSSDSSRLIATTVTGDYLLFRLPDVVILQPESDLKARLGLAAVTRVGDTIVASFSPDGTWLATVDIDGVIALRDPASFERVEELRGGGRPVESATGGMFFSADGRFLLSTLDGSPRLWDIESARMLGSAFPNDDGVVASGAEGEVLQLVTGVGEHILVWNLDTDSWAELACWAAGRNLTEAEWERHGPTDADLRPTCAEYH